jgi:hypothetical protein
VTVLPRVAARHAGLGAMRTSAWRPWWRRIEEAAAYLDATSHRRATDEGEKVHP